MNSSTITKSGKESCEGLHALFPLFLRFFLVRLVCRLAGDVWEMDCMPEFEHLPNLYPGLPKLFKQGTIRYV